jgi:glyoxylase-like metal-dependent hydrolase (beta-lactamase superfamily II)
MKVHTDTKSFIEENGPVAGVLLTHLHLDHVSGMRDVPNGTPVFVGPGEASNHTVLNAVVRSVTDKTLEGKPPLRELSFTPDPDGAFAGILDLFGDATVWALWVPGHTAGSIAIVARTPKGPVLLTGDACHTAWGWKNGVEPGSFSEDQKTSATSLDRLEKLASRHKTMDVRLGHQLL